MTCAWTLAMFPATHSPGTLVAPVGSASIWVPNRLSPIQISCACSPSGASRSARARHTVCTANASSASSPSASRTPVRPDPSDSTPNTCALITGTPRASSCSRSSGVAINPFGAITETRSLSWRNINVWCTALAEVASTPIRRSRTSQPWQYGQCTTSRPQCSASPGTSGSSSREPVATSRRRARTRPVRHLHPEVVGTAAEGEDLARFDPAAVADHLVAAQRDDLGRRCAVPGQEVVRMGRGRVPGAAAVDDQHRPLRAHQSQRSRQPSRSSPDHHHVIAFRDISVFRHVVERAPGSHIQQVVLPIWQI